jgi:hypothetical protein
MNQQPGGHQGRRPGEDHHPVRPRRKGAAVPDRETVTVAGVPVTVQAVSGDLAVTAGRYDPAAGAGQLRIHPRYGTAVMGLHVADPSGDTGRRPGQRWFFDLYPDSRDITAGPADPAGGEVQR